MVNRKYTGILLLLPLFLILLIFIILPLLMSFIKSFLDYSLVNTSFNRFRTYRELFKDDMYRIAIKNTVIVTFTSTVLTILISYFLGYLAKYLTTPLKSIIGTFFMIISLTYLMPLSLKLIFANDVYGYINSFLKQPPIHFFQNVIFLRFISVFIPTLIGLGPIFIIFIIFHSKRETPIYFHLAITLQSIIAFSSFYIIDFLTEVPSI